MGRGAFGGLTAFYSLNNAVLRTTGRDSEAIAGNADRLVVAGVYREAEEIVLLWGLAMGKEGAEHGVWGDCGTVGDGHAAACGVVYRKDGEILNESAAAPHIEELNAEADGEDWLVEVVGVLDEEFVNIFAEAVGWGALGDGLLAVFLWIDVCWTTGEEDSLAGIDKV